MLYSMYKNYILWTKSFSYHCWQQGEWSMLEKIKALKLAKGMMTNKWHSYQTQVECWNVSDDGIWTCERNFQVALTLQLTKINKLQQSKFCCSGKKCHNKKTQTWVNEAILFLVSFAQGNSIITMFKVKK